MTILETSQIIFNVIISLAVIVVTALLSIIAYDIIKCIKATKKFLSDISKESAELYEKINSFLENILKVSFISKFFKKKKSK